MTGDVVINKKKLMSYWYLDLTLLLTFTFLSLPPPTISRRKKKLSLWFIRKSTRRFAILSIIDDAIIYRLRNWTIYTTSIYKCKDWSVQMQREWWGSKFKVEWSKAWTEKDKKDRFASQGSTIVFIYIQNSDYNIYILC
jgi:hypothetical protein